MTEQSAILRQPKLNLLVNDDFGYVSITADTMPELFERIAQRGAELAEFAASNAATADAKPAPRPRKAKAEAPVEEPVGNGATTAGTQVSTAEDSPAPASQAATDEPANDDAAVTYEDVRNAVVGLAAAKGRDAAIAVLDQFGVDHASKLTEAQWPEALAALTDAKAAS